MKIALEVVDNSGKKEEVVCTASDILKFEDTYNISIVRLDTEMKMTHLLFLAHASLTRQGKTNLEFKTWVDTIETIGAATDPKS